MFSCITPPHHLSQVMETTNEVMDHSLFELVTHEAAMSYHRVFVANLLANALKYAPDSGPIELGAAAVAGGVRLWVRDCGPGIAADEQSRVFEKFGVLRQPSGRRCASCGLGLAFCKLAVEAQGGSIGLISEPGVGSTFWCQLPAATP